MSENQIFENATELLETETVEIDGSILPPYVNGFILRNGPGKFDLPSNFTMNSFYDGYAMLTRLEIKEGKFVTLTKKYLDSEAHRKAMGAGRPCVLEFCTRSYADPERSILFRHLPDVLPVFSDNGNTGIYKIGKDFFTCAETCNFQRIDPNSLTILNRYDTNAAFGIAVSTTHPITDPDTGIVYNMGPSMLTGLKYHMLKLDPSVGDIAETIKKSEVFGGVSSSSLTKFSYSHSFGMSENYFVHVEQPYQTSIPKVLGSVLRSGQSVYDLNGWNKKFKNRFNILSKSTGKSVSSVEIRAETQFFFYHVINCHELKKGGVTTHVVVDIFTYPNDEVQTSFLIANMRAGKQSPDTCPHSQRFVIPLVETLTGIANGTNLNSDLKTNSTAIRNEKIISIIPEDLSLPGIEFPTVNARYIGKPYKYFYGTSYVSLLGSYNNSIVKVNTITKEVLRYSGGEGVSISEGIFVPNPDATSEDDGLLIVTVCHSAKNENDHVVFLDAKTMEEIARANFSTRLPIGCHGLHFPSECDMQGDTVIEHTRL